VTSVDPVILEQRVRNRIIECLELFASATETSIIGPDAAMNLWYDFVPKWSADAFPSPTYSGAEREAVRLVHEAVDLAARSTPDPLPSVPELMLNPSWQLLMDSSEAALREFRKRGKLSEETPASD